jgi:hypothetical protein
VNKHQEIIGSLLPSFEQSAEDLKSINEEMIGQEVIVACLSQPNETGFTRLGNSKPCRVGTEIQIPVTRFPINLCPILTVQRAFDNPRLQTDASDQVMSRAYALFAEIPGIH